jgi:hypothetical protein
MGGGSGGDDGGGPKDEWKDEWERAISLFVRSGWAVLFIDREQRGPAVEEAMDG